MRSALFIILLLVASSCSAHHDNGFCDKSGFTIVEYEGLDVCVSNDYYMRDGIRMPLNLDEAFAVLGDEYVLPTPGLVKAIWEQADVKLSPAPLPPGSMMSTMKYFVLHDQIINQQLDGRKGLIAGHKKDLIRVPRESRTIGIYGWFRENGSPIQPVNTRSHSRDYKDYSHGLRLVERIARTSDGTFVDLKYALTK